MVQAVAELGGLWLVMVLGGSYHDSGLKNDWWCDSLLVIQFICVLFSQGLGLVGFDGSM